MRLAANRPPDPLSAANRNYRFPFKSCPHHGFRDFTGLVELTLLQVRTTRISTYLVNPLEFLGTSTTALSLGICDISSFGPVSYNRPTTPACRTTNFPRGRHRWADGLRQPSIP